MADLIMKIPVPYEPKRKNRWLVSILTERSSNNSTIQEWVIKNSNRPKFIRTKWWNFWKRFEVAPIRIEMYDPIGPSTAQVIHDFMVNDSIINYDLSLLDPTGVVVEKWEVRSCKILNADFGELNFKKDKIVTCSLLLKPDTAKLLY